MTPGPLLGSWYVAGFEGSSHRRRDGQRLDLVAATAHDRHAARDFRRMRRVGITAARESLRWHLVEQSPGSFDFEPELSRFEAAAREEIVVAWDLCHFGVPDHVDPASADFPGRFAAWAHAAAQQIRRQTPPPYWVAPQNEISYLAWCADHSLMNPGGAGDGQHLKRQLVRGAILAIDAVRAELPGVRFLHPEPLINVAFDPNRPHERDSATTATEAQFEAWDMLSGRLEPELGGSENHLDVLGVNYYPDNQWSASGPPLDAASPLRSRLADMLVDLHRRYGRDILISETGTEDDARAPWLASVSAEVTVARSQGVPVGGICVYPVVNHPGWEDDRHCRNGIWDYPDRLGRRRAHHDLVRVVAAGSRPEVRPLRVRAD